MAGHRQQFIHDCDVCDYIGSGIVEGEWVDWYRCLTSSAALGGTVLGRFGDDGPDYWSSPLPCIADCEAAGSPWARAARIALDGWEDR